MNRLKKSRSSRRCDMISSEALIWLKIDATVLSKRFEVSSKECLPLVNFLCSLLAYSLRTLTETAGEQGNNIVVIIECQKLTSKLLKLIMRASQNALAFKINHIIVLESDNFLEQQKISLDMALESYDFKTTICSRTKLWKHVKKAFLLESMDSLKTWDDMKNTFEQHFFSNPVYFGRDGVKCIKTLSGFYKKGNSIVIQLGPRKDENQEVKRSEETSVLEESESLAVNASSEMTINEHQTTTTESSEGTTNVESFNEASVIDEDNVFETDSDMFEMQDWLKESVCKFMQDLKEVSPISVEQSNDLSRRCGDINNKLKALQLEMGEQKKSKHGHLYDHLDLTSQKIDLATEKLSECKKLQKIIIEFDQDAEKLIRLICSELPLKSEQNLKENITELDRFVDSIEQKLKDCVNGCSDFMEGANKDTVTQLSDQLSSMTERKKNLLCLADLRKLKIYQIIQLSSCEKDISLVIIWFNDLSNNLLLTDPCTKVNKFEDVARKLGDYGTQLCEVSLLLRRSLRLEISAQTRLQYQLLDAIEHFEKSANKASIR